MDQCLIILYFVFVSNDKIKFIKKCKFNPENVFLDSFDINLIKVKKYILMLKKLKFIFYL